MEIKTKFNLEDKVWAMSFSYPKQMVIKSIRTECSSVGSDKISYGLAPEGQPSDIKRPLFWQYEKHIAYTKNDMLDSFMDKL